MIKKVFIPGCLLILVFFSSCSSQLKMAQKQKAQQISRKVGFTIHPKENLVLYEEIADWLGTPYRLGGNNKKGVDCSGLVRELYRTVYQKPLNRTVSLIYKENVHKIRKGRVKSGDLIFFRSQNDKRKLTHVGLYLKRGYFVHASTSKGVRIDHLDTYYYKKMWKKSGRVK